MKHKKHHRDGHRESYRGDHMAPNAGSAESQGGNYPYASGEGGFGRDQIGLISRDAYTTTWDDPGYAMMQYHDGSMDYLSQKDKISRSDIAKVHRDRIPETMY
jgi:hypothetical protein